jgi:molybdate transport system substrate-binding protein
MSGQANDLKILSTIAVQVALERLIAAADVECADRLSVSYGIVAQFEKDIAAGRPFDIALFSDSSVDRLIKSGCLRAEPRLAIASSTVAAAVSGKAPRFDVTSIEALVHSIAEAGRVVLPRQGISGILFIEALERLGLYDRVRSNLVFDDSGGFVAHALKRGDAAIAIQLASELLAVPGVRLLDPLPAEFRKSVHVVGGVSASCAYFDDANAFLHSIAAAANKDRFREAGMEPSPERRATC